VRIPGRGVTASAEVAGRQPLTSVPGHDIGSFLRKFLTELFGCRVLAYFGVTKSASGAFAAESSEPGTPLSPKGLRQWEVSREMPSRVLEARDRPSFGISVSSQSAARNRASFCRWSKRMHGLNAPIQWKRYDLAFRERRSLLAVIRIRAP
jgi:hypothetical protein